MPPTSGPTSFQQQLYAWHESGARPHPWKASQDPYKIWLSEIILQQTRVETGTSYYLRFVEKFPSVEVLAAAALDEVYELWKGLGYYSRAKNLHLSAQLIMTQFNGKFPNQYEAILSLKGVGPYTAAAIASFAYDLPFPVVDGNVKRVVSRYIGYEKDILASGAHQDILSLLSEGLFDSAQPAKFNQAIMDFGATVCRPKAPLCQTCPMQNTCYAYQSGRVSELPLRINKIKRKTRYFHYIIIEQEGELLFHQRQHKDIWQNLFEFPLIETDQPESLSHSAIASYLHESLNINIDHITLNITGPKTQLLSHQKIVSYFYSGIVLKSPDELDLDGLYTWMSADKYYKIAVPKTIDWYLHDNSISLFTLKPLK